MFDWHDDLTSQETYLRTEINLFVEAADNAEALADTISAMRYFADQLEAAGAKAGRRDMVLDTGRHVGIAFTRTGQCQKMSNRWLDCSGNI